MIDLRAKSPSRAAVGRCGGWSVRLLIKGKLWRRGTSVALFASTLMLAGCAVGPNCRNVRRRKCQASTKRPATGRPRGQTAESGWQLVGDIQDAQLNALEQRVTVSNQNLKAAEAHSRQASAFVRFNRADYFPTVGVAPNVTQGKVSSNRPPAGSLANGKTTTDIQLPFALSYEVDAWGRVRSNVGGV